MLCLVSEKHKLVASDIEIEQCCCEILGVLVFGYVLGEMLVFSLHLELCSLVLPV